MAVAEVKIVRDDAQRITIVSVVTRSPGELVAVLFLGAIMLAVAAALYLMPDLRQSKPALYSAGLAAFLFLFGLARLVARRGVERRVADASGLRFWLYPELGAVPWIAVQSIHAETSLRATGGPPGLIADLRDAQRFVNKLGRNNENAPGHPRAPAFATIEPRYSGVDLRALEAALTEFLAQAVADRRAREEA
jgi:hypothetical protein